MASLGCFVQIRKYTGEMNVLFLLLIAEQDTLFKETHYSDLTSKYYSHNKAELSNYTKCSILLFYHKLV